MIETMTNTETLLQFIYTGIQVNFIAVIITYLVTAIKISLLPEQDREEIIFFLQSRRFHIKKNHPVVRIVNALLIFLPFYKAWIMCVMVFNYGLLPGSPGILRAYRRADEFSIVTLIVYQTVGEENK